MSLFKEQTPAQIIATQVCDNCLEEHSDKFYSCKSSYSAQHPILVARLAVKSIRKRDHLDNYQEVNPFARAEPGMTNDTISGATPEKKIDRDTKLALLLLKGGMRGKELKKHFPETFAKMSNGRWQRVYSKLKKEVNKKIEEGKDKVNKDLNENFQQYTYKLAEVEYRGGLAKKKAEKTLEEHVLSLLEGYSETEKNKILEASKLKDIQEKASEISQNQLDKDSDCVYNNLNTDQGMGTDCMVHAWNAFMNFPYIQQLVRTKIEMKSISNIILSKTTDEEIKKANNELMGSYCKWKELILPVLKDNKTIFDQALITYNAQIDSTTQQWFQASLDDIRCDDSWMQDYMLGTIQLLSIANLFHPTRPNEIILFTQTQLQDFIDDDGTKFDSSYGAIPINSQLAKGAHAICIKKGKNNEIFVVDSWDWKGVHPYDEYVERTHLKPTGDDVNLTVLVKIKTAKRIEGNAEKISDELKSLYSVEHIKKFKLCHTNKEEDLSTCPFTDEFIKDCGKIQ